jgi:deoxyribonuclease-4
MKFGAHVSIAGGVQNAPKNAKDIGCETFQMFTHPPQMGRVPDLSEKSVSEFKKELKKYKFTDFYVHAPYIVNFASANPAIRHATINVVRNNLERADLLGATAMMTHLGSSREAGREDGLKYVVKGLDEMLLGYGGKTQFLIEISAGAGSVIGDTFEEIVWVLKNIQNKNVGVCFDTQHAFASGYDLRSAEKIDEVFKKFDKLIGLEKLAVIHTNDSKTEFNSHKDRHEHIGKGFLGLSAFEALLSRPYLKDKNFILETESDLVEEDLRVLKNIRKKLIKL